ncbi:MAG: hypoxanthine phosphoribosyltransferase [Eubacterium sp.]|nr:hypoxanthine phosphoribosyltransferase [Eubacterium sp.]
MNEKITIMIDEDTVDNRIKEIAAQISRDYAKKEVRLICILKGSVFYTTELAKRLTIPTTMDFMKVSSYGSGTVSSGKIKIQKDLDDSIEGLDVIVVEDIVDSGNTLSQLIPELKKRNPRSLAVTTLLDKPSRREVEVHVDYTGFEIEDKFVVGYGLDYDQSYRDLPFIGVVELDGE